MPPRLGIHGENSATVNILNRRLQPQRDNLRDDADFVLAGGACKLEGPTGHGCPNGPYYDDKDGPVVDASVVFFSVR